MVTAIETADPYTLVAHHLQDGDATRAELRALTDLDYAQISAALDRFEMMENVEKQADSAGIEHYSWKGNPYQPDPPRLIRKAEPPSEDKDKVKDGVAGEDELRLPVVRPKGWSLIGKIRELLRELPDGDQFTMPVLYNTLLSRYPNACETYESGSLRTQISATLNSIVNREITLVSRGNGSEPNVYRKGAQAQAVSAQKSGLKPVKPVLPTVEPNRVEELVVEGHSVNEMCKRLHISTATWYKVREANPAIQAAYDRGYKRREEIEAAELAEERDSTALESSYFKVIDDLKRERDELNTLIALLEKRIE